MPLVWNSPKFQWHRLIVQEEPDVWPSNDLTILDYAARFSLRKTKPESLVRFLFCLGITAVKVVISFRDITFVAH